MSKQPPPAPTTSAIGPCPTVIPIVGRSGTGSLPRTATSGEDGINVHDIYRDFAEKHFSIYHHVLVFWNIGFVLRVILTIEL